MKEDNGDKSSFRNRVVRPRMFFWCAVLAIPVAVLLREFLQLRSAEQQLESERQKQQTLSQQIKEDNITKQKLQKGDRFLIEKEARETLNFVKKDEVVYKFSTTTTQNQVK